MQIIDLTDEYRRLYFVCLEDWSEEMKEAGDHKKSWYDRMMDKGLQVKLALDDDGKVGGMIQYLPIEHSFIEGTDQYFINCIWVHGYKAGRGKFQKRGMGKALLQAAEDDVQAKGAKAIAAWGVSMPFWMKASWYKKHGYTRVDKQGIQVLVWKPFTDDAIPPQWIRERKKPGKIPGKVAVTAFLNGWCPAQNLVFERAKRAATEFGDQVSFQEIQTYNKDVFLEWGIADALYVDGKKVRSGPPPSYERIRKIIAKRVKKL